MEIGTFEVGVISPLLDVCCYEFLDKPTVIGALCCYEFLDKPTARCMFEVDLSEFYPVSSISCFFYFKCVSTDFFQASYFRPPLTFPAWLVVIISEVLHVNALLCCSPNCAVACRLIQCRLK